jgi:type VI secretion system protein ImpH
MADTTRGTTPALKEDLLANPARYSFFQAIILLRRFFLQEYSRPEGFSFLYDALRIRPHLSLAFPGTDLTEAREDVSGPYPVYHLTATFLGLYGCASPLPTFYTEDLIDERSEDVTVTRDFLDVFNSPLYTHLLGAMSKYRLLFQLQSVGDAAILDRVYCLLGYGHPELRQCIPRVEKLLRYIGLFSQWPRSAMGLRTLISDALSGAPVAAITNVPRLVAIPDDQRLILGRQGASLGLDAYLGSTIKDLMGKVRLVIGPLDDATFHGCLPGQDNFLWLLELISLFLAEPLDCRLEMELRHDQARPARLGADKWGALGLDTWVFSKEPPRRCRAIFELKTRERRHDSCRFEVPAA